MGGRADILELEELSDVHLVSISEVKLLSHVQLFAILWTVDYQAPLSMGFSRQEYWSGLPLPSPLVSIEHSKFVISMKEKFCAT